MFKLKPLGAPPDAAEVDVVACGSPDEDGDCVADDVDNCPGIANASQLLTGETGIVRGAGDACDPDRTQAGNVIKTFWGFNDPTVDDPQWDNQFGGGWVFTTGQVGNSALGNFGFLQRTVSDDDVDLTIEARFVFHSYDTSASDTRMGVWVDKPAADVGGQTCWVTPDATGFIRIYAQESTETPGGGAAVSVDIPMLEPETTIVLQMRRDRTAGEVHCSAILGGTRVDLPVLSASGSWLTMGRVALQARGVVTDATHVTLYTR